MGYPILQFIVVVSAVATLILDRQNSDKTDICAGIAFASALILLLITIT